jgi:sugar lactone lactonase YvrE
MPVPLQVRCLAALGCDVAESPLWWDNHIWWIDIRPGRLFRCRADGGGVQCWELGAITGAIIPVASGGFLAFQRHGCMRLSLADDAVSLQFFAVPPEHPPHLRFNDAKADPRGRVWAGTMGLASEAEAGSLWRIDADGTTSRALGRLTISNGMDWSDDERRFYHIDSGSRQIRVHAFDADQGRLGAAADLRQIPESWGKPDGCCLDAQGGLWVAFWDGACVRRFDGLTGEVLAEINLPVQRPTSCAFGGANLATLFITCAGRDDHHPWAGGLLAVNPGVTGRLSHAAKVNRLLLSHVP